MYTDLVSLKKKIRRKKVPNHRVIFSSNNLLQNTQKSVTCIPHKFILLYCLYHYNDVSVITSQITDNSTAWLTAYSDYWQNISNSLHYWPFIRGIYMSLVNSFHRRTAMRKAFHIMTSVWYYNTTSRFTRKNSAGQNGFFIGTTNKNIFIYHSHR